MESPRRVQLYREEMKDDADKFKHDFISENEQVLFDNFQTLAATVSALENKVDAIIKYLEGK